ncbi:MAG TPA: hypothetical protein VJP02_01115 [Candidatus Sulfotelmatobacter sp.]|nr:hypothetical protein [Candidatus Sulfotelmatobacter sp.]
MTILFEEAIKEVNWEELRKQHRLVIAGNKASVFLRRWLFPNNLLLTAIAFLGTKAIDVELRIRDGVEHIIRNRGIRNTNGIESSVGVRNHVHDVSRRVVCRPKVVEVEHRNTPTS